MTTPAIRRLHAIARGWTCRVVRKILILIQLLLMFVDEWSRWPFVLEIGLCLLHVAELWQRYMVMGPDLFGKDVWVRLKVLALLFTFVNDVFCLVFFVEGHPSILRVFRIFFAIESNRQLRSNFLYLANLLPRVLAGHLLMLFSYILVFSILAAGAFPKTSEFSRTGKAAISLFTTLTTVNFPSIALDPITRSPVSAIFFVVFLCVGIYLLLNLILALVVVYYKHYLNYDFRARFQVWFPCLSTCFLFCPES
jgi:two pore calcium channel protein 2